jgi:hypothetical protein
METCILLAAIHHAEPADPAGPEFRLSRGRLLPGITLALLVVVVQSQEIALAFFGRTRDTGITHTSV